MSGGSHLPSDRPDARLPIISSKTQTIFNWPNDTFDRDLTSRSKTRSFDSMNVLPMTTSSVYVVSGCCNIFKYNIRVIRALTLMPKT